MKTRAVTILSTAIVLAALLGLAACSKKKDSSIATGSDAVDYYTCTMHPSVKSKDPNGKCPICSMDLVPVMKKDAAMPGGAQAGQGQAPASTASQKPSEFTVPIQRQQMIGVRYATVERRPLEATLRAVGLIEADAGLMWEYVLRVEGYVHELFVTSAGRTVARGQPLMTIYSPDLLTTEQEFIDLLRSRDNAASPAMRSSTERLIESAKRRLRLWNVGEEEIVTLEKTRKASEHLVLRSPFDGIVEQVPVRQGMNVKIGESLIRLLDLSAVWMWAEFYENELPLLSIGQKIKVTVPAFGDEEFNGEIAVIDPMVNSMKRTVRVRIDIPNPQWRLRPGMFVNAWLDVRAGEGLAVPVSAIIPAGNRNIAFVDKGEGRLEPRFVDLGRKFAQLDARYDSDYYEVREGLKEGERVVVSANFLIDAESKIQGAIKTWAEEEATEPVEQPGLQPGAESKTPQATPLPSEAAALYEPLVNAYLAIQRTLAHDQMEGLAGSADAFRKHLEVILVSDVKPAREADVYRERLQALHGSAAKFNPATIKEARVEFGQLSSEFIALVSQFPPPLGHPLYTINCPMWDKSPSEWIQTTKNVENPFMGQAMPTCGELVRTVEPAM